MRQYLKIAVPTLLIALGSVSAIAAEQQTSWLFVQSAEGISSQNGKLTLKSPSPVTVFFSDRPKRLAGQMPTQSFMKHWSSGNNSFQKDPPNATISIFGPNNQVSEAVVELSNPRMEQDSIVYDIKVLEGNLPDEGQQASLFIDSSDGGCGVEDNQYSGEPCWAQEAFQTPKERL